MTGVQSVDRISAILRTVANHQEGVGVTEIAHEIDLPVSTVSRFLLALEHVDFVKRDASFNGFRIGTGLFNLAVKGDFSQYLIQTARPFLQILAQKTGESVTLTVLKENCVFCIDQLPSQYNLQLQNWVGQSFPLHTSADGKLYLAHMSQKQQDAFFSKPLDSITPKSIVDGAQLKQQLVKIRRQKYAWTENEYEEGLIALAAPIYSGTDQLIGAIGIGAPTYRFPSKNGRGEIIHHLRQAGENISDQLQNLK